MHQKVRGLYRRRVAAAVFLSALIHFLGLLLFTYLKGAEIEEQRFHHSLFLPPRIEAERFKPRPAIALPESQLERLRSKDVSPSEIAGETAGPLAESVPAPKEPDAELAPMGERPGAAPWERDEDFVEIQRDSVDRHRELEVADPLELDAMGRRQTVALIDPKTGELKKAYLHLPSYMNSLGWHGGRELARILDRIERGKMQPARPPFDNEVHYYRLGGQADWKPTQKQPFPDPIHHFTGYPQRHKLAYQELQDYPFLVMHYIDVESTESMVRYLLEGGLALVGRGQLFHLRDQLQERVGERLELIHIELEHPLFRAYYSIKEYREPTPMPPCPGIWPLAALKLEDRLLAVAGVPTFNADFPCPSNRLYVNTLVYCLVNSVQAGGMLSRYY